MTGGASRQVQMTRQYRFGTATRERYSRHFILALLLRYYHSVMTNAVLSRNSAALLWINLPHLFEPRTGQHIVCMPTGLGLPGMVATFFGFPRNVGHDVQRFKG